jgi:glycine cleavage system transcriptional repressor
VRTFAVSVIGADRPGIVAAVTGALLPHGINIEDSRMAILRGHFAMMLVVAAPEAVDTRAVRADLERVGATLGLNATAINEVSSGAATNPPSHVVTVYGADHPGIVHAVCVALAEKNCNITDLLTRVLGEGETGVAYVLILEVALPESLAPEALSKHLEAVAREQNVEVAVRPLERDAF